MERRHKLITGGLAALAAIVPLSLSASRVGADIGGDEGVTTKQREEVKRLVDNIQDKDIRGDVLVGLYRSHEIGEGDGFSEEILPLLEERKLFYEAANLAKKLGKKEHAVKLYSQHLDVSVPAARSNSDGETLRNLAHFAVDFGLEEKARETFGLAVDSFVKGNNFEAAADVAKTSLNDKEKAAGLYKLALTQASKSGFVEDEIRLLVKMERFDEADNRYAQAISAAERECRFDIVARLYAGRAWLAEDRGDKESKEIYSRKTNDFYELDRLRNSTGFECGANSN